MWALGLSVVVLVSFGAAGAALLRRFASELDPVEQCVYGMPLGAVLASMALLGAACVAGFGAGLVVAIAAVAAALAAALGLPRPRISRTALRGAATLFAGAVVAALALRWLWFWSGALTLTADGLVASQRSLWADGAQHLGDIASFAYGDNFPPVHPRFAGHSFNYHYLTSISAAALVKLGLAPWSALCLHSFLFSACILAAVFVFSRRLGLGHAASGLVLLLLFLGGGCGWWIAVRDALHPAAGTHPLWDAAAQEAANFRWLNIYFALVAPQRGLLYGIPLGLLSLRLLFVGVTLGETRYFVAAGIVAGLFPLAHLGTLLAFALLVPWLFLAFPTIRWMGFGTAWALLAAPQVWVQQAGSTGAASAFRWAPGWVAPPESWIVFWLKNLGAFLPLLVVACARPGLLPREARRFLLAFQPLFLLSNLFVFQPWDWDNTKILLWWYLASCLLVAAAVATLWEARPRILARAAVILVVVSLTLSGVLENVDQARGAQRHLLATTGDLDLARQVRERTDPHALFAVGLQHNHPVPMLAGRRVLMSYPGWTWSQGIDSRAREQDVRSILALAPSARSLIDRYRVGYVVVGPDERRFGADPAAWRALYPAVARTDDYEVFAVGKPPP
jgi:hypothetical protein